MIVSDTIKIVDGEIEVKQCDAEIICAGLAEHMIVGMARR